MFTHNATFFFLFLVVRLRLSYMLQSIQRNPVQCLVHEEDAGSLSTIFKAYKDLKYGWVWFLAANSLPFLCYSTAKFPAITPKSLPSCIKFRKYRNVCDIAATNYTEIALKLPLVYTELGFLSRARA